MPKFLASLKIDGTARKCGSYYRFDVLFAEDLKLKNLRYYPDKDNVWFPERQVRRRKYFRAVEVTDRFRAELYRQCRKRWGILEAVSA